MEKKIITIQFTILILLISAPCIADPKLVKIDVQSDDATLKYNITQKSMITINAKAGYEVTQGNDANLKIMIAVASLKNDQGVMQGAAIAILSIEKLSGGTRGLRSFDNQIVFINEIDNSVESRINTILE